MPINRNTDSLSIRSNLCHCNYAISIRCKSTNVVASHQIGKVSISEKVDVFVSYRFSSLTANDLYSKCLCIRSQNKSKKRCSSHKFSEEIHILSICNKLSFI